ncbi:hypothetical protein BDV98DRAFT_654529 [Pterulicium gracile]|uniref:Uncharacterized protein n=1 Tax=Pterulicium gracile TaxID=1884261 RepID=A0A5C3QRR4_9AGAR|nr:hypothetical protein BDV98DRAFT_654529 [Pterula gracilis]
MTPPLPHLRSASRTARGSRHVQNASRFHVGELRACIGTGNTLHLTRNQSVRTDARGGLEPGGAVCPPSPLLPLAGMQGSRGCCGRTESTVDQGREDWTDWTDPFLCPSAPAYRKAGSCDRVRGHPLGLELTRRPVTTTWMEDAKLPYSAKTCTYLTYGPRSPANDSVSYLEHPSAPSPIISRLRVWYLEFCARARNGAIGVLGRMDEALVSRWTSKCLLRAASRFGRGSVPAMTRWIVLAERHPMRETAACCSASVDPGTLAEPSGAAEDRVFAGRRGPGNRPLIFLEYSALSRSLYRYLARARVRHGDACGKARMVNAYSPSTVDLTPTANSQRKFSMDAGLKAFLEAS